MYHRVLLNFYIKQTKKLPSPSFLFEEWAIDEQLKQDVIKSNVSPFVRSRMNPVAFYPQPSRRHNYNRVLL